MRASRRVRRDLRVRRLLLAAGETVDLPCRLRRTSARGWGPWTEATLHLARRGVGRAEWEVSDPLAVGLTPSRAAHPVAIVGAISVELRKVRFREEAFEGMRAEIVVVTAERHVTEFALPVEETDEVYRRLDALVPR